MKPYYEHAGISIFLGDCREILPQLDRVDWTLTDPPYGIRMSKGFEGFGGFGGSGPLIARRQYPDCWDENRPSSGTFGLILRGSEQAIIWGGNFFADILPRATHWLVWDKLNTMPSFGDCELAWTSVDRKSVKKITVEWNGLIGKEEFRDHPTQKPILLMKQCLKQYSGEGQRVRDPFMGSGTTLFAAKQLGIQAEGIEIEEKYCEIAAKRLSQEVFDFSEPK
jgi:DNA modification methylase